MGFHAWPALRDIREKTPPARFMRGAFTVLELLVACTILSMLIVLLLSIVGQTSSATRRAGDSVSAFQGARAAFDLMTSHLAQATLGSYWDYQDASGAFRTSANRSTFRPQTYGRQSELHFLIQNAGGSAPGMAGTGQSVAFQLPSGVASSAQNDGLSNLLNACAYYVEYGDQESLPSPFSPSASKYRYRLMQALEPSEDLSVYKSTTGNAWVAELSQHAVPIADNVIYLSVWPRKKSKEDSTDAVLTEDFTYDSRRNADSVPQPETAHRLSPLVQVMIVCIDEASAARVCTSATPPSEITNAFSGLFTASRETEFEQDVARLESRLAAAGVTSRIFTTLIPLRESKME
jgi:uncharacterized protein (TIGR02599 family)